MALHNNQIPAYLKSGERARLIPVIADSKKEERITSSTLATFMSVREFAKGLLSDIGVSSGKNTKTQCYTEIVFDEKNSTNMKKRPDGLIVINTGRKQWSAIIEAKIGKAELEVDQIDTYLDIAKDHKIDAVITISNQFTTKPNIHPLADKIKKTKTRSVSLYHWSWTYLITQAQMQTEHYGVADTDQAYILSELLRYLKHDSSGILSFSRMNDTWKEVCGKVRNNISLNKKSPEVLDSIDSWHQFVRYLSLKISSEIGANTEIVLKRAHRDNANKRIEDDVAKLIKEHKLSAKFEIPNAASHIKLVANIQTHSVSVSMRLDAPKERSTSKGRINWLLNQLKDTKDTDISIRVIWPYKKPSTQEKLSTIRENGFEKLIHQDNSQTPSAFEVILKYELGAKFKGAKTFIDNTEPLLLKFYEQAGQHLKEWVAPPPKIKSRDPQDVIKAGENSEAISDKDNP